MQQTADSIALELVPRRLQATVSAIAAVARDLSARIARRQLSDDLGAARGSNSDGDQQKALDVIAESRPGSPRRSGSTARPCADG